MHVVSTLERGLLCQLDETVGKSCVLRSPLITFNWSCVIVRYYLSNDVKLTADLLVDGVSVVNYTLMGNNFDDAMKSIPKEDLGSSISLQLTASRYLVSTADYEFAFVDYIKFYDWCEQEVNKGMRKIVNCSWQKLMSRRLN